MPQAVTLRPARSNEADALARLHSEAFGETRWDAPIWQRYLDAERSIVIVAEKDGQMVGGLAAHYLFEEAELLTMMVAEEMRGCGIGASLIAAMLGRLRATDVERVFLEVRESNLGARRLYGRAGFVEAGRRRGYYPATDGREDAVLMRRSLP